MNTTEAYAVFYAAMRAKPDGLDAHRSGGALTMETWAFYYEGWRYLAQILSSGELQVRRAVSGRPWITPTKELTDAAFTHSTLR